MSEYDVKVTRLYGDTYRVEVYESARPAIFGLLALVGFGFIAYLMKEFDLTFEQAVWTVTGTVSALVLAGAGIIAWVRSRVEYRGW